ncbi:MAG TPA: hypothetical protein PKD83_10215 [Ignavibacteria bacterium]|nr:hypothetical protein [Ignavibacteria bacterium]
MTRKQLRNIIILTTILYCFAFILGIYIYFSDVTEKKSNYAIFKDLIPFMIAIPIAFLGYCFQRRANYLLALRPLWTNLIISVNTAIEFTHQNPSTQKEYGNTLMLLSASIDEVRGVYSNLNIKQDGTGYYPFESLKSIHKIISDLGYGNTDKEKQGEARKHIYHNWKNLRQTFLLEFDRPEPTVFDSPYIPGKKKVFVKRSEEES